MDKELKTALANVKDPQLRKILAGLRGLQRLRFALWSASVEQEPVRGQALAVVDAILGKGWRTARADRWIPVTERLPDYGVTVDVWDSERGRVPDCDRVCLSDAGDVWADIHGEDLRAWNGEDNVTHWRMPPAPPEVPK